MPTKAEQAAQQELVDSDRSGQVAVEPDHQPVPTIGGTRTIAQALIDVMRDVREVKKAGKFTGGATYDYRGIEHVLNEVGPAFRRHGVMVLPRLISWKRDTYQTSKGSTMWRYVVEVEYVFVGPAGDTLKAVSGGEGADSADKAFSKAMAVALRVALLQTLAIPTQDEDGESTRAEAAAALDMRTINAARQHLESARKASSVAEVAAIWDQASADGSIQVKVEDTLLSEHLTVIGSALQAQVTP